MNSFLALLDNNTLANPQRTTGFLNVADVRLRRNTRGGKPINSLAGIDVGSSATEIRVEK